MTDVASALGLTGAVVEPGAAAARLTAALLAGGVIGLDREARHRPAGLRTHMLVALAAAVFTLLAFEAVALTAAESPAAAADPVRVIEAITAGVAFLAAGTIIVSGRQVFGLTMGASLWLAGAAGVAAGLGLYWLAYLATAMALLVLTLVRALESAARRSGDHEAADEE